MGKIEAYTADDQSTSNQRAFDHSIGNFIDSSQIHVYTKKKNLRILIHTHVKCPIK